MKLYKYVNDDLDLTYDGLVCEWRSETTNSLEGNRPGIYRPDIYPGKMYNGKVYHAFIHPLIGELFLKVSDMLSLSTIDPINKASKLLEVKGLPVIASGINKIGCRSIEVVKAVPRPFYGVKTSYFLWWVIDHFLSYYEEEFWEEYFENPRLILEQAISSPGEGLPSRERAMRDMWSRFPSPSCLSPVEFYTSRLLEAFPSNFVGCVRGSALKDEINKLTLLQRILDEVVAYESKRPL